jgi:TonB family protein
LPSASETDSTVDYKLDLSLDYRKLEKTLSKKNNSRDKELNLWKHIYPVYSTMPTKMSRSSFGRYRTRTAHLRERASIHTRDYDLTPWAVEVVERIQKNWQISPALRMSGKGMVKILVIVERNGELQSVEIVNSSMVPLFDRAALKAVEASSPFPGLPDDFPADNLEAYFVFEYSE